MEDNIQANALASSAMETFLNHINSDSTLSTLQVYPGWGTKTITLANGKSVILKQTANKSITESNLASGVDVTINASSGRMSKELKYELKAVKTKLKVDPEGFVNVTSPGKKYVLSPEGKNAASSLVTDIPGLKESIATFLSTEETQISSRITVLKSSLIKTGDLSSDLVIDSADKPYGSESNPVVLLANSVTIKNGKTLTVYGDAVFNSLTSDDSNGKIIVKKYNETSGNLFVTDSIGFNKNEDSIEVDGMLYAKNSIRISNNGNKDNSIVKANSIIVTGGPFELKGRTEVEVTKYIAAQKIEPRSDYYTKMTVGWDLLAQYNFIGTGRGEFNITAGGVIAGGDNVQLFEQNSDPLLPPLSASGTTTILQCSSEPKENIYGGCTGLKYDISRK